MKYKISLLFILLFISLTSISQYIQSDWQNCYGGSSSEGSSSIAEGVSGYSFFCVTGSNDGDISFLHGESDYWLIKTDLNGNLLWEKTYGGSDTESIANMIKTLDGGLVMFGHTFSNDGDVTGLHGLTDYWIVKIDSLGYIEWQKCMGGSIGEIAYQVKQTPEGGYICVGYTASSDGDITGFHGFYDAWVVKLSSEGEIEWNMCYGGSHIDWGQCITTTNDGGYIMGGLTMSTDGDVLCKLHSEYEDIWVVKLDSIGNIEWQQCYGGSFWEGVRDIKQIEYDGFIFIGTTNSNDGDVSGFHGTPGQHNMDDIWVVKLDDIGNIEWQRCLGGFDDERAIFIKILIDRGYLIGGNAKFNNGDVSGNHSYSGYADIWLVKLSVNGNIEWKQCFGGKLTEGIGDIIEISSSEFIILGGSNTSDGSGDVTCDVFAPEPPADFDVWAFQIKDTTTSIPDIFNSEELFSIFPNPAKDQLHIKFNISGSKANNNSKNTNDSFEIINSWGEVVMEIKVPHIEQEITRDISNLKTGLYFIRLVSTDNKSSSRKFIKY